MPSFQELKKVISNTEIAAYIIQGSWEEKVMYAEISGLSVQGSNPYTTDQSAYSFISEIAAKGFCQAD